MLSSTTNVAPPAAAARMPASTAPGPSSAAPAGVPSFSQMLSDQAEPPRPAPVPAPTPTPASPRAAEKAPAEAPSTNPKSASPTPRKDASGQRATGSSQQREPASDAAAATDTAAAHLAAQPGDDESGTSIVDTAATDDGAADDDVDAPQVSGLNEFTQLIGLPLPTATSTALGRARELQDARDSRAGTDTQRVGASARATAPQAPTTDGAPEPAAAAAEAEAADSALTGAADSAARTVAEASAGSASNRRAASSLAEDAAPRPGAGLGRADTDKPSRSSAHRATDPGPGADTAKSRTSAADPSTEVSDDHARMATATPATASAEPQSAARPAENGPLNFSALMAQNLASTSAAEPGAPTASGRVHASMHSAAFAPELAAQVSLLAVDGVQTAQLQLNPAEMGPVAVQIIVDGAQAQVSFQAAQADTRQALEKSLPDLAAALQGQGLTLSGGGVFQQAPRDSSRPDGGSADGPGNGGTRAASRRVGATESMSTAAGLAPARPARGLLDTFA